ncbi:MAG: hypothetical protein ABR505_03460 [Actinomycetota bacterium]
MRTAQRAFEPALLEESGRSRRKGATRSAIMAAALLTIALGLFPSDELIPSAQAGFPGHNGSLAFSITQTPRTPGAAVYLDYDLFSVTPWGAVRRLTEGPGVDLHPNWSPDGRYIVFERELPPYLQADMYLIKSDGTGETRLTDTPDLFEFSPAWSPDAQKIVFTRMVNPYRSVGEFDLFVMNSDGSNIEQITSGPDGELAPAWSPDGQLIAFQDWRTGYLGVIRPDGRGRTLLTDLGAESPQWSPDGETLVWFNQADIWTVRRDGSHLRNLTSASQSQNRYPAWSPDGKYIAFVSDRDGGYRIYRMRADGTDVTRLIDIELDANTATLDWGPRP